MVFSTLPLLLELWHRLRTLNSQKLIKLKLKIVWSNDCWYYNSPRGNGTAIKQAWSENWSLGQCHAGSVYFLRAIVMMAKYSLDVLMAFIICSPNPRPEAHGYPFYVFRGEKDHPCVYAPWLFWFYSHCLYFYELTEWKLRTQFQGQPWQSSG